MAMEKITENGVAIALVTGTCALTDEQTALDLIMEARYTLGAERIAIAILHRIMMRISL